MHEDEIFDDEQQIADERTASLVGGAILTKPIRALKLRLPIMVRRHASVRETVRRMVQDGVGCVCVVDNDRLVGIFTERDVLRRVVPQQLDADRTQVSAVMTEHPETLSPDAGIAYALNKMSVGGFRHVPLVDENGRPVGVVGMRDIVEFIVDMFPQAVHNLPPEPGLNISRTREGA